MDRPKFEYKIFTILASNLKREAFRAELLTKFNELGKDGWELINAEGIIKGGMLFQVGETAELMFLFKRMTD